MLRNLRAAVRDARVRLADDLRALGPETRLGGFMEDSGVELEEIYARARLRTVLYPSFAGAQASIRALWTMLSSKQSAG